MLWAACCLGFFGFFCAGQFTTCLPFDPRIHWAVSDPQANALADPTCFKFQMGCNIYVGCSNGSICPMAAIGNFLALHGPVQGLLLCHADGGPSPGSSYPRQCILSYTAGYSDSYSGHRFHIGTATIAAA